MLYIDVLTILQAAHLLKRFVDRLRTVWRCMIRRISCLLPSALFRHSSAVASQDSTSLFRHGTAASSSADRSFYQQPMVGTRATRRRKEGMQQIAERLQSLPEQQHEPVSSKLAAVLVPLFQDEDGVVKVWLTQRAMHLNSHKGMGGAGSCSGCTHSSLSWQHAGLCSPFHLPATLSVGGCRAGLCSSCPS
jgi:hypothetical protein